MNPLSFASSNSHKLGEVRQILAQWGIPVDYAPLDLTEIQADNLEPIAREKARQAAEQLRVPAFVEDAGLFIEGLNGFPGPYSAYVLRTMGIDGVLRLLCEQEERRAAFRSVIGYCEPGGTPRCFLGAVEGAISRFPRGGGWGYDPIFVPDGAGGLTFGELGADKNARSHRLKSLRMFAEHLKCSG